MSLPDKKTGSGTDGDALLIDMQRTGQLVALDALFRLGSVSAAADSLNMHVSAMSRLLAELRAHYGDRLFSRTGRGMMPTPFAETLRQRVRNLVAEAEELIGATPVPKPGTANTGDESWQGGTAFPMPPLAVTQADPYEGAPSPALIAQRISSIDGEAPPVRRLAKYIAISGPGPGRSRTMTAAEAEDAFSIILRGEADPIQIGALLMPVQYRSITANELAGFVKAVRSLFESAARQLPGKLPGKLPGVDLDWPAYVSASWRRPPWFVHSARLVANAGFRIVMHGYFGNGDDSGKLETAASDRGIPVCRSLERASDELDRAKIVYLPLGALAPQLQSLLGLYHLFETRTPLHLVPPLLNPLNAKASLLGAAQVSRRDLFREAAQILDQRNLTVVGSMRDFAQLNPAKAATLYRLVDGEARNETVPSSAVDAGTPGPIDMSQREYWNGVWTGAVVDDIASATIIGTAAAGLQAAGPDLTFTDAMAWSGELWKDRLRSR